MLWLTSGMATRSMPLAARAGAWNPRVPAHPGRRRRRRRVQRRIVALGHVVPGVANAHVPHDTLIGPTTIHVHGIAWAPTIWAVAARAPGAVARLGGPCAETGPKAQTAGHQLHLRPWRILRARRGQLILRRCSVLSGPGRFGRRRRTPLPPCSSPHPFGQEPAEPPRRGRRGGVRSQC
jgi:hypothetical protein